MAHYPYSFSNPADPTAKRPHRPFQVTDERARAWDSEAPATAHDSEFERKESRAPLYIAGAASVVILGGLLLLASAAVGEPALSATVETETVPRQAALSEMLDAQALDRARSATLGLVRTTSQSSAPADAETMSVESASPAPMSADSTSADSMSADSMSGDSMSVEASPAPSLPEEPLMTPAPTTTSPILLDRDNPYTPENEAASNTDASDRSSQRGTASDNPY